MIVPIAVSLPFRFLVCALLACFTFSSLGAQVSGVSRTPPAAYAEQVAPLLTPLSQILAAPVSTDNEATAQVLIDENVHLVAEDGRVLRVRQVAYRALTEASFKSLAEDLFSYGRDRQKFHLVRAVAIQPDGTEQPVASDAILVQSPQRQANLAIYDDTTEVRVIYPRIPVGGVTHTITVTEETEARLPGAYTSRFSWGSGWPTAFERQIIELPQSLASRLRWFTLGAGAVEPVRETLPDSRVRLSWQRVTLPARRYEVGRAPALQVGPALHLTTLTHWDEVAAWFQSLLDGRDQIPAALATEADKWVRSAPDRDAVLRILFSKVADEIRYTSLALNEGDYQPQSCAAVWDRRHGDCKDKSNLLVALLRRAGIPAHIALVNTHHLGLVDRRAPDYRVFSHAIVAVPVDGGGYTFCDPTIASGAPGILSPTVADRDVLVVREGRADWVHIPPQSAGRLDYVFELALNPAGELSGWLTLTADGVYGAWERERYRDQDNLSRRDALARTVRGFFPGADVIDIVPPDPATSPGPAVARAYFVVSGQTDAVTGPTSLRFPRSSALFLDLGTTESRETAYFVYQDQIRVSATFKLPVDTATHPLPSAFQLETPAALVDARWHAEPGVVRADLRFDVRQSSLSPREFARLYQAMLALDSWFGQPLALRADAAPGTATPAIADAAIDLPLMPTGQGQLELIAKRYPYSGNRALRRAALQRAVQYFPNDSVTAYEAGIHIAVLDWNEDRNQEAFDRIGSLLAAHRQSLSGGLIAWGESLQGLTLRDLGRTDEAVAFFSRIATDTSLGAWRRSQDALNAIEILAMRDPAAAYRLAIECSPLVSEHQPELLTHLVRLGLGLKAGAEIQEQLAAVSRAQPAEFDHLLAEITKKALSWSGDDASEYRARWLTLANALAPAPGAELRAALDESHSAAVRLAAAADIQRRLREAVAKPPLATWFETSGPSAPASWTAYAAERTKLVEKNESDATVLLGVRVFLGLPANEESLDRIWRIAGDADWHERRNPGKPGHPAMPLLLDLCDLVPKPHDSYYEGRFVRATGLAHRGDRAAERAVFDELFADPRFPSSFHLSGHARRGLACEHLGDFAAALASYRELENDVANSDRNTDCILRAVLINLHLDRAEEALRLIGVLEKATEDTLRKATGEYFIRELIALRSSGQAERFWAAHRAWWPQWEEIVTTLRLPPAGRETVVPVIPELAAFKKNLTQAEKDKDSAAFWREFRTVVSAGRWLPSLAPEVSDIIGQAIAQAPAQKDALTRLLLAQLAIPGTPNANTRLREFHVIATLHDNGDHAGALAAANAFLAAQPADEFQRPAVARVHAMSALAVGRELAESSAELERQLADPAAAGKRFMSVQLLADLYRARRLGDEEHRLLQRELANPHIVANQNGHRTLTTRFEQLGGSLRLAEHVRDWLRANPLPWYDYAEPASLDDPRLRNLAAVLENPGRQFGPVEVIKLRLLAAQNPDIGLALQGSALSEAVQSLHELAPTHAEATRIADAFIDHAAFDESIRASFLWHLFINAYFLDRRDEFERWKNHPLAAHYNADQIGFVVLMARSHAFNVDDAASLTAFADELRAKELDEKGVMQLQGILVHYLRLDELDRARELVESIPGWRFVPGYTGSHASTSLRLTRTLRGAEEQAPVHRALVARVRRHFPVLPAKPPASFSAVRVLSGVLPHLSAADTRDAGLWMIGAHRLSRQDFEFWTQFIQALHHDPSSRTLAFELIEAAVQAAPDDEVRAALLEAFFYTVDYDEPTTLARLNAIVAPYNDPIAHPLSARYLRVQNFHLSVRFAKVTDFEASLGALDAADVGYLRTRMTLSRHLQRDDVAALKRTLRALDDEMLLNPGLLHLTVPALARSGLKTEHKLALGIAEKELRSAILTAWVTPSPQAVDQALDLAEMLKPADPFPAGWVVSVSERCPHPMYRGRVRITDAWLRADWTTAAREARAVLNDYPTYHRFQWYAGAALYRAGKIDEARPHLETYVKYANDEIEHPAAVALLAAPVK